VHQVPQLVREEPETLARDGRLSIERDLIASTPILGDRAGDGVVQASVQHAKVFRADRRVHVQGEFGDRLTDVAVVMDDLRNGKPLLQQVMPVLDRAHADLEARAHAKP
jgi:hypothetical protein